MRWKGLLELEYIFRVQQHSELVPRLAELDRQCRMRRDPAGEP
ncbi:hypothetical protein [Anaeromyxobacter paludicola]|uniref:Uncharacterized protein n=1 Tax=Anaeromyxobacter paludicola TaxID=2918171 RepID=A0ABM7XCG3_9BACT|nr:hypothetical protein [Anaeromyxobacter paludicola]BDG09529.1 hypothetical protein AMPC_26420 [Anaeromyxobacter paludicola]